MDCIISNGESKSMDNKSTEELENTLQNIHLSNIESYYSKNESSLILEEKPFAKYMRNIILEKGLRQQDVFLAADVSERYGYKLISEEKRTRQRDIILRICYAAHMTLEETQRALSIYGMPKLYAKYKRDAFLMLIFKDRPGDIIDINAHLKKSGFEALRGCGIQE